jgi:hypothetical protein
MPALITMGQGNASLQLPVTEFCRRTAAFEERGSCTTTQQQNQKEAGSALHGL